MRRFGLASVFVVLLVFATPVVASAQAYFGDEEYPTGYSISPKFVDFWTTNGGVEVFGYPLGDGQPIQMVDGRPTPVEGSPQYVQYFERTRLELHRNEYGEAFVLIGLLGAEILGFSTELLSAPHAVGEGCMYLGGYPICGDFQAEYMAHGIELGDPGVSLREALMLNGFPLGAAIIVDGLEVQYFERVLFEQQGEDVMRGLLGTEVFPRVTLARPL